MERAVRWAAHIFQTFARVMAKENFDSYDVDVQAIINASPPSAAEVQSITEQYNAGFISLETAMRMAGVTNIPQEIQRLGAHSAAELRNTQARTFLFLVKANVPASLAAEIAGFSKEIAEQLADIDVNGDNATGVGLNNISRDGGTLRLNANEGFGETNPARMAGAMTK